MEQGSMERQSRLPLAPSRLPLGGGSGVSRVQMAPAIHSGSGLPRLFNRPPQGPVTVPCEMTPPQQQMWIQPIVPPPVVQQSLEEELTAEEQEWKAWVGKRVCISGIKKGTLMYVGTTSFAEGLFCGISLDEPEGRHDGELKGRRYFNCNPDHGVFAPISKVERIVTPRLPPISFTTDQVNRTFSPGKVPSEELNETFLTGKFSLGLNETFLANKTQSPVGGRFNETFLSSKAAEGVGLNETFFSGKSQSFGTDIERMLQLAASPTSQNHTFTQHKHQQQHFHKASSPQKPLSNTFLHDDSYYEEEESSLGVLTDSQMLDFSTDGLLLMPKTQSCDDIHDLPEEEVVQDITVQYLGEPEPLEARFLNQQSTPIDSKEPRHFLPDMSTLDDGSFSLIADQELPSCAFDFSLCTLTEGNPNSDEISQQCSATEMPEEIVPVSTSTSLKDLSPVLASNDVDPNFPHLVKSNSSSTTSSSFAVRSAFVDAAGGISSKSVDPALVSRVAANAALPEGLFMKIFNTTPEAKVQIGSFSPLDCQAAYEQPAEVKLRDKGQRSLETSLTKSVEWNDVVMVQSGEDCKEERLSIEKVMEVIQAKGANGQRPASTYTVGSADTGYQGDAEFDMQSEIETASPCEEMKQLVSSSVCTSLSMDDANAATTDSKLGKSGHLSDSDFFTEDPGEAEGGCSPDADAAESLDVTVVAASARDPADPTAESASTEEQVTGADGNDEVTQTNSQAELEEPTEPPKGSASECGTLRKKKQPLPPPPPPKKIVGVSKIKALMESQPSTEHPKRARTPKKSRWDAVTSKIQANMAEDKVKPKREVRGRVNTNLVAARTVPPTTTSPQLKKLDPLALGRLGGSGTVEGSASAGPGSTRSTPVTESLNLPVDGDDTASQATTSARGTSPSLASTSSQSQGLAPLSASSSLSSIPSTFQQQQLQNKAGVRVPSKIAVRLHPRLEPVATVSEPPKRAGSRPTRGSAAPKTQKPAAQNVKGASTPVTAPQTPTAGSAPRLGGPGPGSRSGAPAIRSALSTASPLVIPSSSRQQRQKLEELGREVQHLGALCESRTKELNRVKMQLRHASLGFDAFATLVQYLAGELNAFSHPDLVSEIQTTKEQLITLETFLKQCEGDLEEMREKHAEELGTLSKQLQQAQGDTAQLQEKLEHAEQEHSKQCDNWDQERDRISREAQARHQAALENTKTQHTSQIEALLEEHARNLELCDARHKAEQAALTEQLDHMKERCRELQEQARSIEEALQKDTDTKIQWLSAKNADLQKEVESLKSVLEMKQGELHELRKENLIISKQAEELPMYRQRVNKLMSRMEDLQALLREKSKNERRLSCDQRNLQDHLEKESKMNRQLSMEKDELMWRLSQSMTSSTGSLNNTPFAVTPEFSKKKRAVIPFRLTPASLPPFREGSQDESPQKEHPEENQVTSTSDNRVQHRARVRVNRTRSCHTSPRDSPSHNSRMVTSTPNMPCDDDNNSIDEASSTSRLSPCDSLTELHRKACMQLDCADDTNVQQQHQQQLFSPNGISSNNSSMTSSAAEDLSLSSTEDDRRNDHTNTSPRSLAGEAMTEEMRISMATPESPPPGENVAPPSDAPCFCDDYDISSEPE